jgi:phospholipid/cholesterol/gamma-HCH transport system substrate-binding protein
MSTVTKKAARSFYVGVVTVAVLGFVVYLAGTANRGLPLEQVTDVKVAFANVATLRAGDAVRQNSVRIGRVASVEYVDGHAVATLKIDDDITVHRDAQAMIADESSLAKRFVELEPGTSDAPELGDAILPLDQTMAATDINDVLDVFDAKTRDRLQVAVRGLGGGAAGRSEDLHALLSDGPQILDDARSVLATLRSDDAELPELLGRIDGLARTFQGHEADLRATVDQLAPTLEAVGTYDSVPLRDTVRQLPGTLAQATRSLGAANPVIEETRQAVRDLRPGADALGAATPALRGVLRAGIAPLHKVPDVADLATPALRDLAGAVADARPLADPLTQALVNLERPLRVLAPYSRDVLIFFSRANSLVSTVTPTGDHMARLGVAVPGLQIVNGGIIPNPDSYRIPYPAPGAVDGYRVPGIAINFGDDR